MRNEIVYFLNSSFIIFVLIFIMTVPHGFLDPFNTEQQLTLVLLIVAVYLWTISTLPKGAASILILVLMIILNLVGSVEEAVIGFLSPALYFIFILTTISKVLIKVGLDKEVSLLLLKLSKSGSKVITLILPFTMLFLPLILPSAFARFKMLFPLIEKLNESFGFKEKSFFKKYSLYVIGIMNQNATIVVYTGGGFPILAAQLLSDYNIANLSWTEWFFLMAPPLWIGLFVVNIFTYQFLKNNNSADERQLPKSLSSELETRETRDHTNRSLSFWFVVFTFSIMIIVWMVTDQTVIPILVPPMILLVIYSIPKIGLITDRDIKNFDWENFLLLGSSFSIGALIEKNGTAQLIAENLMNLIPENSTTMIQVIFIAIIIFLFRLIFVVPSSAIIVIFPIIISYSEVTNLSALSLAFLIILVIGGTNIFPIHAPPSYFAYQTGVLTRSEHYTIATTSTIILVTTAILASIFWW